MQSGTVSEATGKRSEADPLARLILFAARLRGPACLLALPACQPWPLLALTSGSSSSSRRSNSERAASSRQSQARASRRTGARRSSSSSAPIAAAVRGGRSHTNTHSLAHSPFVRSFARLISLALSPNGTQRRRRPQLAAPIDAALMCGRPHTQHANGEQTTTHGQNEQSHQTRPTSSLSPNQSPRPHSRHTHTQTQQNKPAHLRRHSLI